MSKIDYQKIFNHLLEEYHHKIDKIKEVIERAREEHISIIISFEEIINSKEWTASEKIELLKFFEYDSYEHELPYYKKNDENAKMLAQHHTIKFKNISGFEAIMATFKNIKRHHAGVDLTKDEALRKITKHIHTIKDFKMREEFMGIVLKYLTEEDLKRLISPFYNVSSLMDIEDESIFIDIIRTESIPLIEKTYKYVDNLNQYFNYAIETENMTIIDWFIEHNVSLNYCHPEPILGSLTPLKKAIQINNYEIFMHLINKGAAPDLKIVSPKIYNQLAEPQIELFDEYGSLSHESNAIKEENDNVQTLRFIRESTPLEFATTLAKDYKSSNDSSKFKVRFKGATYSTPHEVPIDIFDMTKEFKNRAKICDYLFEYAINYPNIHIDITPLLGMALMAHDSTTFAKYLKYANDNGLNIDHLYLIDIFITFADFSDTKLLDLFLDSLKGNENLNIELFNRFFFNKPYLKIYYHTPINEKFLKLIPEKERTKIVLVPLCRTLKSLQGLISLGFDIAQEDDKGENILFKIMKNRTVDSSTIDLFDYLLENLDLSHKNKEGKNALYYGLTRFSTKNEYEYKNEKPTTFSDHERLVIKLINKMKPEDVIVPEHIEVLESRLTYREELGDKMHMEYVYLHHKDLWESLIAKGLTIPDSILDEIFSSIYSKDSNKIEISYSKKDFNILDTLEFIYSTMDRDTKIQNIDIESIYRNIREEIDNNKDISLERFKKLLSSLYAAVRSLVYDYKRHVKKKYRPKHYEQYVKDRYNVTYHNLDAYITRLLIKGLQIFGTDVIDELLELIPKYDLDTIIQDENIDYSYWDYSNNVNKIIDFDEEDNAIYDENRFEAEQLDCDYDENIRFFGGLVQYGILMNDIELVKKLVNKGAKLSFYYDDENHTWDYVSSNDMQAYISSVVGERKYQDLDEEEKKYLLSLVSEENEDA